MTTWEETKEFYLLYKSTYCASGTVRGYGYILNRFINYCKNNNLEVRDIRQDDLLNYILYLRKRKVRKDCHYSSSSLNSIVNVLRDYVNFLYKNRFIDNNITICVNVVKTSKPPVIPLTYSEVDDIFGSFNLKNRTHIRYNFLFRLMLECGLRLSECLNLNYEDIDLNNRCVIIRNAKCNKNRCVPITDKVIDAFDLYRCVYCIKKGILFLSNKRKRLDEITVEMFIMNNRDRFHVPRLHSHLFRHTFAFSFLMCGGNIEILRRYLGHTSLHTTIIYLKNDSAFLDYDNIYKLDPDLLRKKIC